MRFELTLGPPDPNIAIETSQLWRPKPNFRTAGSERLIYVQNVRPTEYHKGSEYNRTNLSAYELQSSIDLAVRRVFTAPTIHASVTH